jgi:hypothetical protein
MTSSRDIALPAPGEIWHSGAPHHLNVRVLSVELAMVPPSVEYEVLDDDGSGLTGPLRVPLDASWYATFTRQAASAAA